MIVLPAASSVVMPKVSAFEIAVSPATRVLSIDVPPVSAVGAAVMAYEFATVNVVTSVVETHATPTCSTGRGVGGEVGDQGERGHADGDRGGDGCYREDVANGRGGVRSAGRVGRHGDGGVCGEHCHRTCR